VSFVPLARAAQIITGEENVATAEEKLREFLLAFPECAEEVLCQYQGFWGIRGDFEHLREEYRAWAQWVQEWEEQQRVQQLAEKALPDKGLAEKQALSEKRRAAGRAGGKKSARRRKNS
jgi:hypothetical protein